MIRTAGDGSDAILGGAQNDRIDTMALDGDDYIVGGTGNDVIDSWWGDHEIHGGGGEDVLAGSERADNVHGLSGFDYLSCVNDDERDGGEDFLHGGAGNDVVEGGAFDDHLEGGPADDQLRGDGCTGEQGVGLDDLCDGGTGTDSAIECERVRGVENIGVAAGVGFDFVGTVRGRRSGSRVRPPG